MISNRLNDWLSLSANLAVIVGIVVLVIEINQNTQAIRLSSYQDLTSQILQMNNENLDNEYRREIVSSLGLLTPACLREDVQSSALSEEQQNFFISWLFIALRHGDMAYFQYESGVIDYERMISAIAPLSNILTLSFVQQRWQEVKDNFVPQYQQFIDELTVQMADRCRASSAQ